ncbi:MAG: hypothetical protein ACRDMY_12625 [Gaiellaceae bacterium]
MRRLLLVAVVATTAVGLTATPVAAKEGVEATLLTPVPLDAVPGQEIKVSWTLSFRDESGTGVPFNAEGVFVELLSAGDGGSTIGSTSDTAHPTGEYRAVVPVPDGGIGGIQIALMGWADGEPAPLVFPITNNPPPAVTNTTEATGGSEPAPAAPEPSRRASALWIAAPLVFIAALAAIVFLFKRGRHPATA